MRYLIGVIAIAAILPMPLHAQQTWHVYPGESIQEHIDDASSGDVVVVHSEINRGYTYYESLTLKAGVTVHSVSSEPRVTIDGESSSKTVSFSGNGQGMYFGGPDIGFDIDGSTSQAVWLYNCQNLHVEDLDIVSTGLYDGVICYGDSSVHLKDVLVVGGNYYGMLLAGDIDLTDCTVEYCTEGMHAGYVGPIVQSATIRYCDYGFVSAGCNGLTLHNSTIRYCTTGVQVFNWGSSPSEPATLTEVTVQDCETGMDISTYDDSVTEWADIDGCYFWECDDGLNLGQFKGSVTGCEFVDIYDTALRLSDSHALASIGGAGHGNMFQNVDGIGIHLAADALATVAENEFDYVLGTAIQCESGNDSTTISDCDLDGSGDCFEGIYASEAGTWATVRECKLYDYQGHVSPEPRGAAARRATADFGTVSDYGNNDYHSNSIDLQYINRDAKPDSLYAVGNWWGEDPPTASSFAGLTDYIVYDPWLDQSPPRLPIPDSDLATASTLSFLRTSLWDMPEHGLRLGYRLPTAGHIRIGVWDLLGRRVRTLLDGDKPAGQGSVTWDGRDNAGRPVSSGVYVGRLRSDGGDAACRLVLVRQGGGR